MKIELRCRSRFLGRRLYGAEELSALSDERRSPRAVLFCDRLSQGDLTAPRFRCRSNAFEQVVRDCHGRLGCGPGTVQNIWYEPSIFGRWISHSLNQMAGLGAL